MPFQRQRTLRKDGFGQVGGPKSRRRFIHVKFEMRQRYPSANVKQAGVY